MNKAQFLYARLKTEFRYSIWINLKRSYPDSVDNLKAIFIHIPKTAGISIYDLIGYTYIGHVPYSWYRDRDEVKFKTYFKFSVVRNPWDRLVSTYFYLKKGGSNAMDRHWYQKNLAKYADFDEFVRNWINEENVNSWMHFIPQHRFIYDQHSELQVDYVARFENLSEDFSIVSKHLNLSKSLPHVNASKRSFYRNYYDEETRKIVESTYKKDIQLLSYTF